MSGGIDVATAGWSLAATLAMALTLQGLRAGRRRSALNQALHELRRPLQALSLAVGGPRLALPVASSSLRLAGVALERIDREINGGRVAAANEPVDVVDLVTASVERWRGRAVLAGGSLRAGRMAPVPLNGDASELAQALDNLIVNAIEHGGPSIVVEARASGARLRLIVSDSGRASRSPSGRRRPGQALARFTGRRRRGHGLSIVRSVAGAHRGRFVLRRSEQGSLAVIELPLTERERAA